MDRAYSLLVLKSVDDDARIIRGLATTPEADFAGDVIEPRGAKFRLPIPLLLHHDHKQPVGTVTKAEVTDHGIEIEAHLPAGVSERVDEAWRLVKSGILRGLSIGARVNRESVEKLKGGGNRVRSWIWHELSLVSVGMNAGATVSLVRSIDQAEIAATATSPDTGRPSVKLNPKGTTVKTTAEQLADLRKARDAKAAEAAAIMAKTAEEDRSTEPEEAEKADDLLKSVETLDADITRLEKVERLLVRKGTDITIGDDGRGSADLRSSIRVVEFEKTLEPGIEFTRYVKALYAAKNDPARALDVIKAHHPEMTRLQSIFEGAKQMGDMGTLIERANVVAGTTTATGWAAPLIAYRQMAEAFREYYRPMTIIGQLGRNGVPGPTRVPFMVKVPGMSGKATAGWVGEGKPKPMSAMTLDTVQLDWNKIAVISALTKEALRFSNPGAESVVRRELTDAIREREDLDFVDPTNSGTANVKPASITNGASTATSAGGAIEDVAADIRTLMAALRTGGVPLRNLVLIGTADTAVALSLLTNGVGQPAYPDMGQEGGRVGRIPFIASDYVPSATAGSTLILVNTDYIYLAEDPAVEIDVSDQASLQFLDNPTNDTVTPTATSMVSLWQTNSVGFRAELYVTWKRAKTGAVAYLTAVDYDGA